MTRIREEEEVGSEEICGKRDRKSWLAS